MDNNDLTSAVFENYPIRRAYDEDTGTCTYQRQEASR